MHLRASLRGYILTWLAVGAVILPILLMPSGRLAAWPGVALFIGLGVFASLWLAKFHIHLLAESLSYSTLFGGTVSIRVQDIARVRSEFGGKRGAMFALVVECFPRPAGREIRINMKPFRKKELTQLLGQVERLGIPVKLDPMTTLFLAREPHKQSTETQ